MFVNMVDIKTKQDEKNNVSKRNNKEITKALLEYKKHMVNEVKYKEIKESLLILENK